jgi:NAD(P)H-flavin reductase/ferredoxin
VPTVVFDGQAFECGGETSVLDCLTAAGIARPSSCRSGICHTCMMRCISGAVPERAQAGLSDVLVAQNFFLPCVCYPENDLEIVDAGDTGKLQAQVTAVEWFCDDILGIRLKPLSTFAYHAGQFIGCFKDEHTARSYSLASVPALEDELQLHVRIVPNGKMSPWLAEHLKPGDTLTITDATGNCFYMPGQPEQNILLIGTGTGLAPLYGIIRDALHSGHRGTIHLYHGSVTMPGLYLDQALRELERAHANFTYTPCISGDDAPAGIRRGMVLDAVLADHATLTGWRVFLCGHPEMVKTGMRAVFLAGASLSAIHADPFI